MTHPRHNTSQQSSTRQPRPSLNSDSLGRDLTITIWIAADGRVFFNDITVDLQPVVAALTLTPRPSRSPLPPLPRDRS